MFKRINKKWMCFTGIFIMIVSFCIIFLGWMMENSPKPSVPERVKINSRESLFSSDGDLYSHKGAYDLLKTNNPCFVRIKVSHVNTVKYYWTNDENNEMNNISSFYPENIKQDGKGKYTMDYKVDFQIINKIYGNDIKKGHEIIVLLIENDDKGCEDKASGYIPLSEMFFVDENNKIATVVPETSYDDYRKVEGMSVEDFEEDIRNAFKN